MKHLFLTATLCLALLLTAACSTSTTHQHQHEACRHTGEYSGNGRGFTGQSKRRSGFHAG